MQKHQVLFLADNTHPTAAVSDHIHAITNDTRVDWHVENPLTCKTLHKLDLSQFSAIGIHYSIRPHRDYYLPRPLFRKLKAHQGVKFQFLQDEYQQVDITSHHLAELNMQLLFTLVPQAYVDKAYPLLNQVKKVTVLTAYVPDSLLKVEAPPIAERTRDIFYRSRICDYWLGSLAQDKIKIAEGVLKRAKQHHLNVDVSVREEDRIYGGKWYEMLATSRAVLGTESGASVWDFDGTIEKQVKQALRQNPQVNFKEVYETILKPVDGKIMYNAISPRIFEAAAFKTPLIMFPGEYNGICLPDQHYIPLEKDFSNFEDVVKKLKDDDYLQALADRAHKDLIASKQYEQDKLGEITCDEVLQKVGGQAPQYDKPDVIQSLEENKRKYALLNHCYICTSEAKFILKNVFNIAFDKRHPFSAKVPLLYKGAQRYFLYLFSRLRTKSS